VSNGLRMDSREQLRRYLEQRKEAGERELVLDQLNVDEVLALVGAVRKTEGAAPRVPIRPPPDREVPPPASTPGRDHASADWRDVLRRTGAAPEEGTGRVPGEAGRVEAGSELREAKSAIPDAPGTQAPVPAFHLPPPGLVVGSDDRELFGGAMSTLESLDAVAKAVASCTRCPLYSTATNPVPGQGSPNADLMIVGEAPGATEDEQGLAFVGAAGQLLTKILAAISLKREDVFICNVLKHRPPGNRNPMPDEVTACTPYLFRQFELVQPKAILALGNFAVQTLLQTKMSLGKLRSQLHRFRGVPLIVTYHPAALLRNPSWKRHTWEDVQLVRRILDSAASQP
jgi:uracil-DNA glycosylase family 4